MSGYEVEHNIPKDTNPSHPHRRPDLSTFFSTLDHIDTSGTRSPQNTHALPMPRDISAAFRNLANAFDMMRSTDPSTTTNDPNNTTTPNLQDDLLGRLVESLMESAEHPPPEVQGVSDEFIEQLERIDKKYLKPSMSCPICANPFLEDTHPLVVRLPCHKDHLFDLECIQPWLKLNPTCPLDRQELVKKKEVPAKKAAEDEEDGEYDDMFG